MQLSDWPNMMVSTFLAGVDEQVTIVMAQTNSKHTGGADCWDECVLASFPCPREGRKAENEPRCVQQIHTTDSWDGRVVFGPTDFQ